MKILHIAPENFAGVPMTIVKSEKELGHYSRLITFYNTSGYEQDINLDLPFVKSSLVNRIRNLYYKSNLSNKLDIPAKIPIECMPKGFLKNFYIKRRDNIWENRVEDFIKKADFDFYDFDFYQLDGGLGFLRNCKFIKRIVEKNKKVICMYYGSDLRTRGVIPYIDEISSLNLTVEYYHTLFHPNIHFIPFPFNSEKFSSYKTNLSDIIIGHSPTNRRLKGTDIILDVLKKLQQKHSFRIKLIENLPYQLALEEKSKCSIFIDQISDLGYGISSLESLALGIPTCSSLVKGFSSEFPDHPFIEVDETSLSEKLEQLITDQTYRIKKGDEGRVWVNTFHNHIQAVKKIHEKISEIL
ncbi:hypothetical protein ACFL4T_12015 [candidate division KSB1 bacterium]